MKLLGLIAILFLYLSTSLAIGFKWAFVALLLGLTVGSIVVWVDNH